MIILGLVSRDPTLIVVYKEAVAGYRPLAHCWCLIFDEIQKLNTRVLVNSSITLR